jgi:hypothetical protein
MPITSAENVAKRGKRTSQEKPFPIANSVSRQTVTENVTKRGKRTPERKKTAAFATEACFSEDIIRASIHHGRRPK